jgi:hypothetical protein
MPFLYRKSITTLPPKEIHPDNVEILFEHGLLKFRDVQEFSYRESPSAELMFLATSHGIRPSTTTHNTTRNMFFISQDKIAPFLQALETKHPEFKNYIEEKIAADKNNTSESKLSRWI